jgi:hypothetical protein
VDRYEEISAQEWNYEKINFCNDMTCKYMMYIIYPEKETNRNHTMSLSEKLKRACHKSGETRYQLAKETGLDYASLHRFLDGKTGLNSASMDKLADYLGYKLVKKKGK